MYPSVLVISIDETTSVNIGKYDECVLYHIELGTDTDEYDAEETINHESLHATLFKIGFNHNQFLDNISIYGEHYQPIVNFLDEYRYAGLGK